MKIFFLSLSAVLFIAIVGGLVLYFGIPGLISKSDTIRDTVDDTFRATRNGIPFFGTQPDTSTTTPTVPPVLNITIKGTNGVEINVADFIAPLTSSSTNSTQVSGVVHYATSTNATQKDIEYVVYHGESYDLTYFVADNSFVLTLLKEPLKESRRQGEVRLLQLLGISEESACFVRHAVLVPAWVSEFYSGGKNLGFSFCKGSFGL